MDLNQAEDLPPLGSSPLPDPATAENQLSGEKERKNHMISLVQLKTTRLPLLTAIMLTCLAFSPRAHAACQEGCLTNSNTVLGDNALINNTGSFNTAIGFQALTTNL